MNNLLVFRSSEYPNVYIFGTTHNSVDNKIIDFLKNIKVDIIILEDSMPFAYLSDKMDKIAETYYLNTVLEKNTDKTTIYCKKASDIVNHNYDISDNTEFNIALLKDSYIALKELNTKHPFKIMTANATVDFAIEKELALTKRVKYINENNLTSTFKKLQNQSVDFYTKKNHNEMFLSHLIYNTNTPFYQFKWKDLDNENKHWANNLAENILPNNKDKVIVMFCGTIHLNVFLKNSLINLLDRNYGIKFSCDVVNESIPPYILERFIASKTKANNFFNNGDPSNAISIYLELFDNYKTYCFCGNDQMVSEYLNVIGNILVIYYKQKNKEKLRYYVDIAEKLIAYFNINSTQISLGNKINIAKKILS